MPLGLPRPLPSARRLPLLLLLSIFTVGAAALGLFGYLGSLSVAGSLEVRHDASWDRVRFNAAFNESSWFGARALGDALVTYQLRRADGRSLYKGSTATATFNDADLVGGEQLSAQACVSTPRWYQREPAVHCADATVQASSKRYSALSMSVAYERGGLVDRPSVAFQQELQRLVYGQQDQWESLRVLDHRVRLKMWVANAPGEAVQMEIAPSKSATTLDLRDGDGYAAFRAAFDRAEAQSGDVVIEYQFHTAAAQGATAYSVRRITLQAKTAAERLAVLQAMADRTGRHMVGNHYGGGRNISAQVVGWTFDPKSRSYLAELRISWNGINVASNSYWINGRLVAGENGENSAFELTAESDIPALVRAFAGIVIKVGETRRNVLGQ